MPVRSGVGFQPLKNLLAVLQDAGALIQNDVRFPSQSALTPFAIFVLGDIAIVGLMIGKTDMFPL